MLGLGIAISLGNNRVAGISGLDFTSGSLPADTTFARASSAYYSDGSASVAVDVPRFEDDGLLLEPAATNLFIRSQDFDNAQWLPVGSVVVTPNAVLAPDGTTTADTIAIAAGADTRVLVEIGTPLTAAPYTLSAWLRGAIGGETPYLFTTPGAPAFPLRTQTSLTTAMQRFEATGTATAATYYSQIGYNTDDPAQSAIGAMTLYAWGAQIELGSVATSYIPTSGTPATRAADQLTIEVPPGKTTAHCTITGGTEDIAVTEGPQVLTAADFGGVPVILQGITFS